MGTRNDIQRYSMVFQICTDKYNVVESILCVCINNEIIYIDI